MQTREERLEQHVKEAVRGANTKVGQPLKNGAIIIKQERVRETEYGNEYIVLAVWPGFQPFKTWLRVIGVQQMADGNYGPLDYTTWGHAVGNLHEAIALFEQRVADGR
jgi:hypothetical protein